MGLFGFGPKPPPPHQEPASTIPVNQVDLSKRYDVYCSCYNHDRVYENVRFLGIRTFDPITEFSVGLVSGYLEIETPAGARLLIPNYGIQLLCEHGIQPAFKILRRRRNPRDC